MTKSKIIIREKLKSPCSIKSFPNSKELYDYMAFLHQVKIRLITKKEIAAYFEPQFELATILMPTKHIFQFF